MLINLDVFLKLEKCLNAILMCLKVKISNFIYLEINSDLN